MLHPPHASSKDVLITIPTRSFSQVTAENWFSAESFSQIFQQYLTLDTDQNGLLSPAEMCRQRGFTSEIIARLFEVRCSCCSPLLLTTNLSRFSEFLTSVYNRRATRLGVRLISEYFVNSRWPGCIDPRQKELNIFSSCWI
jgi:hypothetical protein